MGQRKTFAFPDRHDQWTPDRPGRKPLNFIEQTEGNCDEVLEDGEYCGKLFSSTSRTRRKCDEHMRRKY